MQVVILAIPVLVVLWVVRDRRALAPETGASLRGGGSFRPDRGLEGAVVPWRSILPLVRVEVRHLFLHPAPLLFFLPAALVLGISSQYSSTVIGTSMDVELAVSVVPWAWGGILAANLNALRSRRWGTDELLATLPVPSGSRTTAHLAAAVALIPGAGLIVAAQLVITYLAGRLLGTPRPVVLPVGPLLALGGACLGIAVARWLPRPGLAWVAVIATIVLEVNLGALDPRWRWLHFSAYAGESLGHPDLAPAPHGWHLLYLVGGIALVAGLALLRTRRDPVVLAVLAAALVLIVTTGWVQVRPVAEADVATFAARLDRPEQEQRCIDRTGVSYCAIDPYLTLVDRWDAPVQGVRRRLPAVLRTESLVVRQRRSIVALAETPTEVLAAVDPTRAWPDDDEVSVGFEWATPAPSDAFLPGAYELALGFRVASAAVGLPADAHWSPAARGRPGAADWATDFLARSLDAERATADPYAARDPQLGPLVVCSAGGQARAVVALWLAAQATPAARTRLLDVAGALAAVGDLDRPAVLDVSDSYREGLTGTITEGGTAVASRDLVSAARLLGQPDDAVAAVIEAHAADWDDPELTWSSAAPWFPPLGDGPLALAAGVDLADPDARESLLDEGPPRPRFLTGTCRNTTVDGTRP